MYPQKRADKDCPGAQFCVIIKSVHRIRRVTADSARLAVVFFIIAKNLIMSTELLRKSMMKLRNASLVLIVLTAAFLLFGAGFCVGRMQSGEEIRVITEQEAIAETLHSTEESTTTQQGTTTQQNAKLNLNTATAEELMTLPGIGEVLAGRIVAYREAHGSFSSIDELAEVEGIGEKRIDAIRDYVTLGGTE